MKEKIRTEVMKVFNQETDVDTAVDNILGLLNEPSDCPHDNTVLQNIRCNVCKDCGNVIEIDI